MATRKTVRAKLIVEVPELYTKYIFQNLEVEENNWDRYIAMTRCPNWQGTLPKINDIGYVTFIEADSGDTYYNSETDTTCTYRNTDVYFNSFIKEDTPIEGNIYEF